MAAALLESLLANRAGAPAAGDWLAALRDEAAESVRRDGLPDRSAESWRYMPLRALSQRHFANGDPEAAQRKVDSTAFDLPGLAGPRLVFVNGTFRADLSRLAVPAGIELVPLHDAFASHAEILRFLLSRYSGGAGGAFTRLNAALARDGFLLRAAAGVELAAPVEVIHAGTPATADVASHVMMFCELDAGSRLTLVERHVATAPNGHLANLLSCHTVRDGAAFDMIRIQQADNRATVLRRSEFDIAAGGRVTLHAVDAGAALARDEFAVALAGDGAAFRARGAFLARGRQHVEIAFDVHHRARGTVSDVSWRGVADGRARGVFHGGITVAAGADGTDAQLSNKNLLLSPDAEIDTRPVLEIHADEVRANHGATVGQLDAHALFYLRSRGIPEAEAKAILIQSFCREVLAALPLPALRDPLGDALLARLPTSS